MESRSVAMHMDGIDENSVVWLFAIINILDKFEE